MASRVTPSPLGSAAVSLEAAVAEALSEARIDRGVMEDDGAEAASAALGRVGAEDAKKAFVHVVQLLREAFAHNESVKRAFNAVANLSLSHAHAEMVAGPDGSSAQHSRRGC